MTEVAVDKLERMLSSRMSPDDLAQMARLVPLPVRQELAVLTTEVVSPVGMAG